MMVRTTSELFALAHGRTCTGPLSCYYCAAPCDESHSTADWVRESFNSHQYVKRPGSRFVCNGCVLSFDEKSTVILIDGTVRQEQRIRLYSWLVTPTKATAATKAHLKELRDIIDNPPPPPFSLVLAESGQKHLLYSGAVNHSHVTLTVTLEGEPITFSPQAYRYRLQLVGFIVAATGKPALAKPMTTSLAMTTVARYGSLVGPELITEWERVQAEPLSRLCLFLSPNKEQCNDIYRRKD